MDSSQSDPRGQLLRIVRQVRRRWRLKLALRGAASVLLLGLLVLLAAAWGLEAARFSARAIAAFRVLVPLTFAVLTAWLFVRPLLRRVNDEQVAMYIEEQEPALQAAIVSAMEGVRGQGSGVSTGTAWSDVLVRRLVESAIHSCAALDDGRCIERTPLRRYAAAVVAIAIAAAAAFLLGPAYVRHAIAALLLVSRSVEAAAPYRIDLTPGNATVPKGADQTITARLRGFDADQAKLLVRRTPAAAFELLPMVRGEAGHYEGMLFDLAGPIEYFVEASGVRSPVFALQVVDLPYVKQLELEYHFPSYTGLAPRKVEDGGDIAVLCGTEVRVRVTPTMATRGGRIVLNDSGSAPLAAGDVLTTTFTVDRDGFYRVELNAPTGERVAASPQYTIDALGDEPPSVSFLKPGRDSTASPIEEVFVEARAEDDYGVRGLELVYSVNGGAEKSVKLFEGRARLSEVTAGHTFFLEELNVQPGDAVSYYARAADNDAVQGAKQTMSDLYFVRIRPFKKEFRQALSQEGGGGGGGAGDQVDALSEQQRRIIAATFNVQRDRRKSTPDKVRENTVVVALSQSRLREQVEGIVTRMTSRLVEPDPAFKSIAALLPQAVAEMKAAETKLQAVNPDAALPSEHRALQFLQKAEEEYQLQVSANRNAGGGGGGGAGSVAEDLAGLFEMELDKLANQYETRTRAQQQNTDQKLDELMEKLKELARRQEQEAERQRQLAAAGQSGAGGGAGQRALAEQVEEAARRLERLSRDENRPEMMDSARRLREAADAMRRAAASGEPSANAQASAALERLRETERLLQRSKTARAGRDVKDAVRRAEELVREQREIAEEVRRLAGAGAAGGERGDPSGRPGPSGPGERVNQRKDALEAKVGELEKQLDRGAAEARRDEAAAARKMSAAADTIREKRLKDKIRYSKALVAAGSAPGTIEAMEADIGSGLDALRNTLGEAEAALGRTKPDATTAALDKARRLARGMESLGERMKERGDSGPGERADPSGSPAPSGSGKGEQSGRPGPAGPGERDGRGGDGDTRGGWTNGAEYGDRRAGRFSPEDIRQFRGEIRQWSAEAQQLRGLLRGEKTDPKALNQILEALRALDSDRVYKDIAELERLQSFVTEGLKRFEYGLRRRADIKDGEVVLSGADEVPEQFRKQVEQYYRSLSRTWRPASAGPEKGAAKQP